MCIEYVSNMCIWYIWYIYIHVQYMCMIYVSNQRKLASNLPSYGRIELWDSAVQSNTSQNMTKGGEVVMTQGSGEVVMTKAGGWGKWCLRVVVTKGSGALGKWWLREVVT